MSNKTAALIASSLAVFFSTFMGSGLNVALPNISKEFQADAILLSWMVTSFVLASAVFSVPFGRIADIFGLKKIFLYGMILYTLVSIIAIFSSSAIMLIACRSVQGASSAVIAVNGLALVTAIYPASERGRALGINIACVYAGSAVGPFIGGILTEHPGWRSIFAVNVPVGLAVILLLLWKLKGEWRECEGEKFDYIGSVIFGLSLVALMYGFSLLPAALGGILIFAGIVGLVIFLRWETGATSPVLNILIFRNNRPFIFSNLAALIAYSSIFAISFLFSLYLQDVKGLSPEMAGLILVAQPVMQAALSPLTGRLSDKIEPRLVASAGMALIFIGLLFSGLLSENTPVLEIVFILIAIGTGFALFSSPNSNAVMSSVAPRFFGVASAIMSTMRGLGQMFSMGITMVIMAVIIGRVPITHENYPALLTSTKIAFAVSAALCFLGIFASLSRGKVR